MIDDRTAQRIAAEWHSGQSSALYALASSGAILDVDLIRYEIDMDLADGNDADRLILDQLGEYINAHGPRSPVPGWYESTIAKGAISVFIRHLGEIYKLETYQEEPGVSYSQISRLESGLYDATTIWCAAFPTRNQAERETERHRNPDQLHAMIDLFDGTVSGL